MNCLVIADDEYPSAPLPEVPIDLLISCGDLSDRYIFSVAEKFHPQAVFAVKGNHDTNGVFPSPIVDLHGTVHEFGGLCFGGFGGCQRYKMRGHHLYEQEEVEMALRHFPSVDVFVAHNSPWGIHDDIRGDEAHQGFRAFNEYIARGKPRMLVHGHQHINRTSQVGDSEVAGVFGLRLLRLGVTRSPP